MSFEHRLFRSETKMRQEEAHQVVGFNTDWQWSVGSRYKESTESLVF